MVKVDDLLEQYDSDSIKIEVSTENFDWDDDLNVVDDFLDSHELNDFQGSLEDEISDWCSTNAPFDYDEDAEEFVSNHDDRMTQTWQEIGEIKGATWHEYFMRLAAVAKSDLNCDVLSNVKGGLLMNLAASDLKDRGVEEISDEQAEELEKAAHRDCDVQKTKELCESIVNGMSQTDSMAKGRGGR